MQIGFRVPADLTTALEKYLKQTGLEKTEYIVGLIRKDLGIAQTETLIEKVESHEIRIAKIEARLDVD
ncbi:hypothetical protein [Phormidium tenue]|jgi:hypothetical protein|uniref:Uncharacterized protein n=1 Tax=Phormidium tenue FACHB-1050 TaxID=2692857 RepID=A0ABR8C8X9_9CYAN|nr:hypothetical protein [Phormidium tenue]MBD2316702.1 hypothetical protein [Phormidium tenue FACHB-1050]